MTLVRQFQELWNNSNSNPDVFAFLSTHLNAEPDQILEVLRQDQQHRWQNSSPLMVEEYLQALPGLPNSINWMLELAVGEWDARQNTDRPLTHEEISTRFPGISQTLSGRLSSRQGGDPLQTGDSAGADVGAVQAAPPQPAAKSPEHSFTTIPNLSGDSAPEQSIGRYRLQKVLGEGAFGVVHLAYDPELQRHVAIKVPSADRFQRPEDAEAFLEEARVVVRLDHPHIVPVYDVGRTEQNSIYVVSKFIEGLTLEKLIEKQRPGEHEAARLLIIVARALQHAHDQGLIHRDVKPANILIDEKTRTPHVADFGLAIWAKDSLNQAGAGTPAYMSPEQARREGHRLDGRSDVFSLGVVLYEMLTGKRPFRGSSTQEVIHAVLTKTPTPPRALLETVPAELERICLKAMSKQASDRYGKATAFAEDLEYWLNPVVTIQQAKAKAEVVPKGLRSFDANDADFFLDLLPGQRNRDGLPESIGFWKQRIEQRDPEQTFDVGLIYGPSGCGKSSLVKAGLLPNLLQDVIVVYVEATPDETELRILRGLRKRVPGLESSGDNRHSPTRQRGIPDQTDSADTSSHASPVRSRSLTDVSGFDNERIATSKAPAKGGTANETTLTETLIHLRSSHQKKIVIIIDQFEQWLHTHRADPDTELVKALRQCDGGKLQAILMIRDDFYVAALRMMQALDIEVVPGRNFLLVDLFDVEHARNVLIKFGQAFGKLPANLANLSDEENEFVTSVANGLAQEGKVVSVRLSLLAEMVKSKPWQPATLGQVGGTDGIGVNFLEDTFGSSHADPRFRRHSAAARGILKSLLPDLNTDIKRYMRSQQELLEASGYTNRPTDFADLLRILDGELRLITPTAPEGETLSGEPDASASGSHASRSGKSGSNANNPPANAGGSSRYYQLTHDYLVPPRMAHPQTEGNAQRTRRTEAGRTHGHVDGKARKPSSAIVSRMDRYSLADGS